MVQEAKEGERWERMWTRAWLEIGDEFANVCKRAIQHWRRLAEQEGGSQSPESSGGGGVTEK